MNDYKIFNDNGEERTWEELYEDNVLLQQENQKLKDKIIKLGLELEDRAYEQLKQENQQIKKDAEFEKTYARSLRKIIYKLYMDIELSTGEFATLRQAIEENEVTND